MLRRLATSSALSRSSAQCPKAFRAFIDESDPDHTLSHAREVKQREASVGQKFSSRYLHALINVAIGHFQKGDYELARQCALYAHDTILEQRKSTRETLLFFSATTCAKCSKARADELAKIVQERREVGHKDATRAASGASASGSWWCEEEDQNASCNDSATINMHENSTLMGGRNYKTNRRGSTSFESVEHYVAFLRGEALQFERIAKRIMNLPEKYFMKTEEQHRRDNAREEAGCSADFESATASSSSGGVGGPRTRAQTAAALSEARLKRRYEDENRRARVAEAEECFKTQNNEKVSYMKMETRSKRQGMPRGPNGKPIWAFLRVPR